MRTVQQTITLFAILLPPAIVDCYTRYVCVGTYDETITMVSMFDYDDCGLSTYLLNSLSCPCPSLRSPKDNYSTIIPSIYVLVGNDVDCSIIWWCRVCIDDFVHGWQWNNHHVVAISIVCQVWWIMYRPMDTIQTSMSLFSSSSSSLSSLPHHHNSPCRRPSLLLSFASSSSLSSSVFIIVIAVSYTHLTLPTISSV